MVTKRILLVDADPSTLRLLGSSLRREGIRIEGATSMAAATVALETGERFQLIVADNCLADATGAEIVERLRALAPTTPLMLVSSDASLSAKIRGLELGVEDYLTKPIYLKEVVTRVRLALDRVMLGQLGGSQFGGGAGAGNTRFHGALSEMPLADLMQALEVARKSGALRLRSSRGQGLIVLRSGKVVHATLGALEGEAAVCRLLLWEGGDFEVDFAGGEHAPTSVRTSVSGLLMEGMRRLDEWRRLSALLPSLDAHYRLRAEVALGAEPHGLLVGAEFPNAPQILDAFCVAEGRVSLLSFIDGCLEDDLEVLGCLARCYAADLLEEVPSASAVALDAFADGSALDHAWDSLVPLAPLLTAPSAPPEYQRLEPSGPHRVEVSAAEKAGRASTAPPCLSPPFSSPPSSSVMSSRPRKSASSASEETSERSAVRESAGDAEVDTAEIRRRDSVDPGPEHALSEAFFEEGERRYSQPPPEGSDAHAVAAEESDLAAVLAASPPLSEEDHRARRVIAWSLTLFLCASLAFLVYNKWYLPQPAPLVSGSGRTLAQQEASGEAEVLPPEQAAKSNAAEGPAPDTATSDAPSGSVAAEAASDGERAEEPLHFDEAGEVAQLDPSEVAARTAEIGDTAVVDEGADSPDSAPSEEDVAELGGTTKRALLPPPSTPRIAARPATAAEASALKNAESELKRGRLRTAEVKFQALIGGESSAAAKALSGLAMVKLQQTKSTEAERLARRAVEANPADSRGWIVLGAALQELGRKSEAFDAYAACVSQGEGAYVTECKRMRR